MKRGFPPRMDILQECASKEEADRAESCWIERLGYMYDLLNVKDGAKKTNVRKRDWIHQNGAYLIPASKKVISERAARCRTAARTENEAKAAAWFDDWNKTK